MAGGFELKIEMKGMDDWIFAWRRFPKEAGKWMSKLCNDMAFDMREIFQTNMGNRYTIRDHDFFNKTFLVEKAKPRNDWRNIAATAGTVDSTGNNRMRGFSGYTEELGQASKKDRAITRWGREGQSKKGIAQPWARLRPGQKLPNTVHLSGLPKNQRFPALVAMIRSGKIPMSKSRTFILGEGTPNHGLYRFRSGAIPGQGLKQRKDQDMFFHEEKLDKIQEFRTQPIQPPAWDWRQDALNDLRGMYTPDFVFKNYIAQAILGIMPEKKPYTPKG
jgi:hypothetical protein